MTIHVIVYKQSQNATQQLHVQGVPHICLGEINFIMYPSMLPVLSQVSKVSY